MTSSKGPFSVAMLVKPECNVTITKMRSPQMPAQRSGQSLHFQPPITSWDQKRQKVGDLNSIILVA